ncbi:MAG: heavy metal translocating P-type ATPase [Granulosicoccus sp.]
MDSLSFNPEAIVGASRQLSESESEIELSVPSIHCAGCISAIEKALLDTQGVSYARVNLTSRRVRIRWFSTEQTPALIDIIEQAGFKAYLPGSRTIEQDDNELKKHIRALAIAGFAAGNVMMLSLSIWSGADEQTRHLFHLVSAAIALPALIFSSRIFFTSAWLALRAGHTNMDVPICVGIMATTLLSLYDTALGGNHVYFDAAIMLVFLLLIGRTLETRMRAKASDAVGDLKKLQPELVTTYAKNGVDTVTVPVQQVLKGDILLIGKKDRIPVDCKILSGISSLDKSLVSGESSPVRVSKGDVLYSGSLNLESELQAIAVESVDESFLARIEKQINEADAQKGQYQQMADKVVSYYTPFVHLVALLGFSIWMWYSGDWHRAITVGVTILIITCPCALGLAVPIARVIAAYQLIKHGVLMKDGAALERLAMVDTIIFDKTGTLTDEKSQVCATLSRFTRETLSIAQNLTHGAEHPHAKAIGRYQDLITASRRQPGMHNWCEVPGEGIEASIDTDVYRLGRAAWALDDASCEQEDSDSQANSRTILTKNGKWLAEFYIQNRIRTDAVQCINRLRNQGLSIEILSGDSSARVRHVAEALNIVRLTANARPNEKLARVQSLQSTIKNVLMVGDGINDSPALAAASVSMVPGTGADMTRKMADFVLLNDQLTAIAEAIRISKQARRVIAQNLALAVGYNVVALPLAMTGLVTPLIAAVAMSLSSVLVIGNSLRLASNNSVLELLTTRRYTTSSAQ